MSHPDRLRLRVSHVAAPHIHGTDAEGTSHTISLTAAAYQADLDALYETWEELSEAAAD